jgi:hypothetical protein
MASVEIPNPQKLADVVKNLAKIVLAGSQGTLMNDGVPFLNPFFKNLKNGRRWFYLPALNCVFGGRARPILSQ